MGCEVSIIIPALNEEDNVAFSFDRISKIMRDNNISFEIIYIDDGSTDDTLGRIKELAASHDNVRYASFSRNFGHEAASSCGFEMASGQSAVLIDADLQDPPEVIPEFYKKWREGYEVVYGRRTLRKQETILKKATSFLFYRVLRLFSNIDIPLDVGDFRLVDRKVIDHFNRLPERNRFVRGMFSWIGFKQVAVEYDRGARQHGETKYSYIKLGLLSVDALVSFSVVPLRICIAFGVLTIIASFILSFIIIIQRLFWGIDIPGYALTTAGMFFLGGVQLMFLGIIGEYVGKIYNQVQGRPLYVIGDSSDDSNESAAR